MNRMLNLRQVYFIVIYACMFCLQDTEDALMMNLRDSHILNHKQNLDWNWVLIGTILKVSKREED